MPDFFHFDHIELQTTDELQSHSFVFPTRESTYDGPQLFGLLVVESFVPYANISKAIQHIEQLFYKEYRHLQIDKRFEETIKKINIDVPKILEPAGCNIDWHKIKSVVGVLQDKPNNKQGLYITSAGNIHTTAFHQTNGEYSVIDIISPDITASSVVSPIKMFSDIIYGDLAPNDFLFITTGDFFDYFTTEKIKDLLTENPENVRKELSFLRNSENALFIASLLLKLQEAPKQPTTIEEAIQIHEKEMAREVPRIIETTDPTESVDTLIETQQNTERMLTPNIKEDIQERAIAILKSTTSILKDAIAWISLAATRAGTGIAYATSALFKQSATVLRQVDFSFIDRVKNKIRGLNLGNKIPKFKIPNTVKAKLPRLPKKNTLILLGATTLILLFFVSGYAIKNSIQDKKSVQAFDEQADAITTLLNKAEARIIARDEDNAFAYLVQAKTLLEKLPQDTPGNKSRAADFSTTIENNLNKIRHIETIDSPTKIAEIGTTDGTGRALYFLNNKLSVLTDSSFLVLDISQRGTPDFKKATPLENSTAPITYSLINDERKQIVLYRKDNSVSTISADGEIKYFNVITPQSRTIDAIGYYNDKLYTISADQNQIYRHSQSGNEFTSGTPWLQEAAHFSNIHAMTVDGTIFIFDGNSMERYKLGKSQNYSLPRIDPPLQSPTQIYTHSETEKLFIVDSASHRIIIIDKERTTLQKQFQFPTLSNIKNIDVDTKTNRMYILNDNEIYSIGL